MEDLESKIKVPPMRTKEKNGACKRKRKEAGGKGSKAKTRDAPIPPLMLAQRRAKQTS